MDEFDLHLKIKITKPIRKKIGWALGYYSDEEGADQTECQDWLEASIKDTLEALPEPPNTESSEIVPDYEAEDIGCHCWPEMESEWNWDPDQERYVCGGCRDVQ